MVHTKNIVQSLLTHTIYYSNVASASVPRILDCQEWKGIFKIISLWIRVDLGFFPVSKNKSKHLLVLFKHWNNSNYSSDTEILQKFNIKRIIAFNPGRY